MINFILGIMTGGLFGIGLMCLLQINRDMVVSEENEYLQRKIKKAIEEIKYFEIQANHINDDIYLDVTLSDRLLKILGGKE